MSIVPYSFDSITAYPQTQQPGTPGQAQGVYFTTSVDAYEDLLNKIEGWFTERDEIVIVDYGVTDKQELGYIILEWDECEIDALFLAILRDEELVMDYTTYSRDLEES